MTKRLELQHLLPDVPHVQNPDRVAAAEQAIGQFGSQIVVLDDGFQHRRLARDLDIVLLDALEPFGYDHVFPRGTLREPVDRLAASPRGLPQPGRCRFDRGAGRDSRTCPRAGSRHALGANASTPLAV